VSFASAGGKMSSSLGICGKWLDTGFRHSAATLNVAPTEENMTALWQTH
jgi:hypothetical protein